jgi:hypothetical protein
MQFIRTHRAALAQKPFAAFLACITPAMPADKYREGVATWLEPVHVLVKPVSEGLFAGALDFSQLPLTLNREVSLLSPPPLLRSHRHSTTLLWGADWGCHSTLQNSSPWGGRLT